MSKPRSKSTINATEAQMFVRNTGRIETLKAAIEKAKSQGNAEREASLQAELERRRVDVEIYIKGSQGR